MATQPAMYGCLSAPDADECDATCRQKKLSNDSSRSPDRKPFGTIKSSWASLLMSTKIAPHAQPPGRTPISERGRAVKLNLQAEKLVLSVNNPEGGSATEELAVGYDADPMEIGFNARYLLDIAGQLEGDEARFLLADSGSPTMVRDVSDETARYVLMPMRDLIVQTLKIRELD